MMEVLCSMLIPFAIWLEVQWRSRWIDARGRLRPSRRERSIAERFYRDRKHHDRTRSEP